MLSTSVPVCMPVGLSCRSAVGRQGWVFQLFVFGPGSTVQATHSALADWEGPLSSQCGGGGGGGGCCFASCHEDFCGRLVCY